MRLEVKNLTKSFGEKEVLHGISFNVEGGKALGLLGRNGAGKTTTIRIIMDVFHANSGEVILDSIKFNPKEHLIGYLPEERGLYPKKKVSEQLIYLGRLRGLSKAEAKKNTDKWLARLQVSQYADVKLETLSKGNQQKVQLASTLVCEPEIVILDEPFSGLYFIKVYNIKIKMKVVIAMRNFKVNGTKVSIVNRCTDGMEINSLNQKYDIMIFNAAYNAWTRLCSCMTLAEGKEIAAERIEAMQQLAIMV